MQTAANRKVAEELITGASPLKQSPCITGCALTEVLGIGSDKSPIRVSQRCTGAPPRSAWPAGKKALAGARAREPPPWAVAASKAMVPVYNPTCASSNVMQHPTPRRTPRHTSERLRPRQASSKLQRAAMQMQRRDNLLSCTPAASILISVCARARERAVLGGEWGRRGGGATGSTGSAPARRPAAQRRGAGPAAA